jgi:hypothetical protein
MDRPSVTTARAAEIVGIGYEGLRSQLKRGLLKNVGTLPPFYGADTPAEEYYAKRWRWSKFGIPDLCLMRVAKILMDAGCAFEMANDIALSEELWRWFSHADGDSELYLTVLPAAHTYCLYGPGDYDLITQDHAGYDQGIILLSLGGIYAEVAKAVEEPEAVAEDGPVDRATVEALCAWLTADDGVEISALIERVDALFDRPRDEQMSALLVERRPPWKILADEVLPILAFLRAKMHTSGRIRFPQDDTAYDAWVRTDNGEWRGIEATGALSRAEIALAGAERGKGVKAGFLGLADDAKPDRYAAALKRPRVMHSRRGVEMQVKAGLQASLAKKNKPGKYDGGTLLITVSLMRLPDDKWDAMAEKLGAVAETLPFDEIYAIDQRKTPPRILTLK